MLLLLSREELEADQLVGLVEKLNLSLDFNVDDAIPDRPLHYNLVISQTLFLARFQRVDFVDRRVEGDLNPARRVTLLAPQSEKNKLSSIAFVVFPLEPRGL